MEIPRPKRKVKEPSSERKRKCTLNILPSLVLYKIFKYLGGVGDIVRCSRVCKDWYSAAVYAPLWKNFVLRDFGDIFFRCEGPVQPDWKAVYGRLVSFSYGDDHLWIIAVDDEETFNCPFCSTVLRILCIGDDSDKYIQCDSCSFGFYSVIVTDADQDNADCNYYGRYWWRRKRDREREQQC